MRTELINQGWRFFRDTKYSEDLPDDDGIGVNLPHTWNNLDGQDGGADYFRGTSVYEKLIDVNKKDDMDYYLEFRGVNTIAHVYVNSVLVGEHEGGFSTFRICVTDNITRGVNKISVEVDNSANGRVYPDTADFTFFGGIYRDVYCIEVGRSRFDLDYFGSEGVMVTPKLTQDGKADVTIESYLTGAKAGQVLDIDIVSDHDVIFHTKISALEPKVTTTIDAPVLWNGRKNPHLYTAKVRLMDGERELDSRDIDFGIRSFEVTKDGFFLNGDKYPLHGVSRHQDRLNMGWAITKKEHEEDMALIKEVGATTIRLAHYQHDQYFYDLCDKNGMVVWAEIPYISVHMKDGDANAISQMKELVIQNYNHASIMFWGLSNEITIGGESEELLALHRELNTLVKDLDKTRLTTLAAVTMCDTNSPVLDIPDIFSYNHYFGWYVGDVMDNAKWIDDFRANYPERPLGISEYGCEAVMGLHSSTPHQGDYSEEYQAYYHENMLKIFEERPYLWSTHVWNMFDFGVDSRDEGGVKGRNNKGLVTYDRKTRKDSFYLYKAYWSDEPFVHICSKGYKKRAEKTTTIKVYTNQSEVSLYVGKNLFGTQSGRYVYVFNDVPLSLKGTNITVKAGSLEDKAKFKRVLTPCKCYTLKEEKKKVANWFEKDGVRYDFAFPEGMFSIHDKLNDILAHPEGSVVINNMMREAVSKISPKSDPDKFIKSAVKLVGNMTLERIATFAGDKISTEMLYHVNEELNKIKK